MLTRIADKRFIVVNHSLSRNGVERFDGFRANGPTIYLANVLGNLNRARISVKIPLVPSDPLASAARILIAGTFQRRVRPSRSS